MLGLQAQYEWKVDQLQQHAAQQQQACAQLKVELHAAQRVIASFLLLLVMPISQLVVLHCHACFWVALQLAAHLSSV